MYMTLFYWLANLIFEESVIASLFWPTFSVCHFRKVHRVLVEHEAEEKAGFVCGKADKPWLIP